MIFNKAIISNRAITLSIVSILLLLTTEIKAADKASREITVKTVGHFFRPNEPEHPYTRQIITFTSKHPDIVVQQWGGIGIPGGGRASLMMSIAGKTAPDIGLSWFHLIRNEISQQFLHPLNEWIGEDLNGNGQIDDDEALWSGWKDIPLLWRRVCTIDGKVYGITVPIRAMSGIVFRIDMVKAAGLDPNNPPKTWDEMYAWCLKLSDPKRVVPGAIIQNGQQAICLPTGGWLFLPWLQSAGGQPILQTRRSPVTGRDYDFPLYETKFLTPDGEDLSSEKSSWRATFASPESIEALDFYRKLRWEKWIADPERGGVPITDKDIVNGYVQVDDRRIEFTENDIIKGVARTQGNQRGMGSFDLLGRGEVAMTLATVSDLSAIGSTANLDPSLLSWFPVPASPGPKGQRMVQIYNHYAVMYTGVGDRPKPERDAVWKTITAICDKSVVDNDITTKVLQGLSRFVQPSELTRMGYEEYIRDIPNALLRNFKEMDSGAIKTRTEPWSGFWILMDGAINRECLSILLGSNGEEFDYVSAMKNIEVKANSGLMFATPKEVLDKWRPLARIILLVFIALLIFLGIKIVKSHKNESSGGIHKGWVPVLMVLPAILIILFWRYYPLLRGMVMAFQDYKITGESEFVGLDNFIVLARDKSFWMSFLRTGQFVFLNMILAFTAPIFLALLLSEAPRFKIFFRTLFFLPQMTSGIVIALMWKLMYNPTPAGFLNQLIEMINHIPLINISTQTWLEDPKLAMVCCVLPTVWASMGMASLIYLAALHSIPTDLYEAVDIDGGGIRAKLRNITLPSLLPLIIINFVGTFIATFQNMGNIFLLTFGGPGEATMVVGLKIWIEAYNNLRFSMATSMAWILGSLLIGLTYIQIQFLGKVEYKRATD